MTRFRIPKRVEAQSFVSKNDGLEKADRKTTTQRRRRRNR